MIKLKFAHTGATRNKQRFDEVGRDPKVGTLYLKKSAARRATELEVTIRPGPPPPRKRGRGGP